MLIAGAGGFAKELLFVFQQVYQDREPVFYDDTIPANATKFLGKFRMIYSVMEAAGYFSKGDNNFIPGTGSPLSRKMLAEKLTAAGGRLTGLISPHALIGLNGNQIADGVTVMTNAVIETSNSIGTGTLVHHGAFISHDVNVGEYCEISPGVKLLGRVQVGNYCSLGTSAVVLPSVRIGNNVIAGAGSVIIEDVPDNTMVAGVPARIIRMLDPVSF